MNGNRFHKQNQEAMQDMIEAIVLVRRKWNKKNENLVVQNLVQEEIVSKQIWRSVRKKFLVPH